MGNDIDVERRFEWDIGFLDKAGVGEVSRLELMVSYNDEGRDKAEADRSRSAVVVMKRRVNADGASSSSLQ